MDHFWPESGAELFPERERRNQFAIQLTMCIFENNVFGKTNALHIQHCIIHCIIQNLYYR